MITIAVAREGTGCITSCKVSGHAGYDEHGYDIVCAAVSGIVCTAMLGLTQRVGDTGRYENEPGYCRIVPAEPAHEHVRTILDTMMLGIEEIARQYPSHVQVTTLGR